MRRIHSVLAAFVFVLSPIASVQSAPVPESCVESGLVESLIHWIGAHSRYDITAAVANPPTVTYCTRGMTIDYEDQNLVVEHPVVALYDIKKRHIFLVEPWDADDLGDASTLLHELVHDVQHLNKEWPCWGKAEWEAYKLQEAWLIEQGEKPVFNWADIFLQSLCPRDVHP